MLSAGVSLPPRIPPPLPPGSADALGLPGEGGRVQRGWIRAVHHAAEGRAEEYLTRDGSQSQSGQGGCGRSASRARTLVPPVGIAASSPLCSAQAPPTEQLHQYTAVPRSALRDVTVVFIQSDLRFLNPCVLLVGAVVSIWTVVQFPSCCSTLDFEMK